jgi:mono/diheme cytochrome c family protein
VRWLVAATLFSGFAAFVASCGQQPQESAPKATMSLDSASLATLDPGQKTYLTHCALCHGLWGGGDGPLAAQLERNAQVSPAKLNVRERISSLKRDELIRVIEQGGAHTNRSNLMPPWAGRLDRETIGRVADFLKVLPDLNPEMPPSTIQAFLTAPEGSPPDGRRLFVLYCAMCHGPEARGDGALADTLWARTHVRPRNLTDSTYFARKTDQDLFSLVSLGGAHFHKSGSMPMWSVTLNPDQIKDLVSYIRSISRTRSPS